MGGNCVGEPGQLEVWQRRGIVPDLSLLPPASFLLCLPLAKSNWKPKVRGAQVTQSIRVSLQGHRAKQSRIEKESGAGCGGKYMESTQHSLITIILRCG